jgi:hypothetical protein
MTENLGLSCNHIVAKHGDFFTTSTILDRLTVPRAGATGEGTGSKNKIMSVTSGACRDSMYLEFRIRNGLSSKKTWCGYDGICGMFLLNCIRLTKKSRSIASG